MTTLALSLGCSSCTRAIIDHARVEYRILRLRSPLTQVGPRPEANIRRSGARWASPGYWCPAHRSEEARILIARFRVQAVIATARFPRSKLDSGSRRYLGGRSTSSRPIGTGPRPPSGDGSGRRGGRRSGRAVLRQSYAPSRCHDPSGSASSSPTPCWRQYFATASHSLSKTAANPRLVRTRVMGSRSSRPRKCSLVPSGKRPKSGCLGSSDGIVIPASRGRTVSRRVVALATE